MPALIKLDQQPIVSFVRRLTTIQKNNERGRRRGVRRATNLVKKATDGRVYPATWANRQDNPQRFRNADDPYTRKKLTRRSPISSKVGPNGGIIRIKTYQASVRTGRKSGRFNEVLLKFLRSNGHYKDIVRPSLKVSKYLTDRNGRYILDSSGNKQLRAFELKSDRKKAAANITDNIINLRYDGRPKLRAWGHIAQRGKQVFRHNIALPAKIRLRLVAKPAVRATEDGVRAAIVEGSLAGFDGKR